LITLELLEAGIPFETIGSFEEETILVILAILHVKQEKQAEVVKSSG